MVEVWGLLVCRDLCLVRTYWASRSMMALSPPLAEGVGEVELAVVFIPFQSGTKNLDGVLGAVGIAVVTGSQPILWHTDV